MEEKLLTVKIEEAKSWFVLAQITIILAGFMFATSGIYYNNAKQSQKSFIETAINMLNSDKMDYDLSKNDTYSLSIYNYLREFDKNKQDQETKYKSFLYFGLFMIILSSILFSIGYFKLQRRKSELTK